MYVHDLLSTIPFYIIKVYSNCEFTTKSTYPSVTESETLQKCISTMRNNIYLRHEQLSGRSNVYRHLKEKWFCGKIVNNRLNFPFADTLSNLFAHSTKAKPSDNPLRHP